MTILSGFIYDFSNIVKRYYPLNYTHQEQAENDSMWHFFIFLYLHLIYLQAKLCQPIELVVL